MNKSHANRRLALSACLAAICIFTFGLASAQEGEPWNPGTDQTNAAAAATGTSFTYQGRLEENNFAANGEYDFRFRLFDALTGGAQVGSTLHKADQTVTNGLFTVSLDFGAVFNSTALWLEVAVRPGASTDAFEVLAPRQALGTAPYASYALTSPWTGLSGVPAGFTDGVDNNTTYAAGTGLTLSGTTFSANTSIVQARVTNVCAAGSAIREIKADGTVTCETDDNTTYTAGTGINLSGGAFSLRAAYRLPQSCADGQLAEWNGSAWVCSDFTHDHWGETWYGAAGETGLMLQGGITGLSAQGSATGLIGYGSSGMGVWGIGEDFGVLGETTDGVGVYGSSSGFGMAAQGNDDSFSDLYGDLLLKGSRGEIFAENILGITSNSHIYVDLDNDNDNTNACFQFYDGANGLIGQTCENGTKSAVLNTASYGQRAVYTVESPEVWLEEFGGAALVNGEAYVPFEATFAEIINPEVAYHVYLTPLCAQPVLLFVTAKTAAGFTVNGVTLDNLPSDCAFDYHIVAKRLGLEDYRLEEVTSER